MFLMITIGVIAVTPQNGQLILSVNLDTALIQFGLMELYKGRKYKVYENGNPVEKAIKPKPDSAIKKIDKAARKNILHKNTAARKKSRLTKRYNELTN